MKISHNDNMLTLYSKQQDIVNSTAKYTVVEAARSVGKTTACLIWFLKRILKGSSGNNYLWTSRSNAEIDIVFCKFKRFLVISDLHKYSYSISSKERVIEINGMKIWFKCFNDINILCGTNISAVVIDEATNCEPHIWHQIRSSIASDGLCMIVGHARGRKKWMYRLARKAESGHSDMFYVNINSYDAAKSGILNHDDIEKEKKILPEHIFREKHLVQASEDGDNPFDLQSISDCIQLFLV